MSVQNAHSLRVSDGAFTSETARSAVESEAPRRVLVTPHPGLDRTTWMRGSASRG